MHADGRPHHLGFEQAGDVALQRCARRGVAEVDLPRAPVELHDGRHGGLRHPRHEEEAPVHDLDGVVAHAPLLLLVHRPRRGEVTLELGERLVCAEPFDVPPEPLAFEERHADAVALVRRFVCHERAADEDVHLVALPHERGQERLVERDDPAAMVRRVLRQDVEEAHKGVYSTAEASEDSGSAVIARNASLRATSSS